MLAPEVIDCPRLRLRRPRLSDAEAIFEYGNDPDVARYAEWPVGNSIEAIRESVRTRAARWESGAEFHWLITLPPDDRAIGGISCCVANHSAEVGFLVDRRYWRNGYATEAARAVVEWALYLPPVRRVWATCDIENRASARVLEKAGMTCEGTLRRAIVRPNISAEPRDAFVYSKVR